MPGQSPHIRESRPSPSKPLSMQMYYIPVNLHKEGSILEHEVHSHMGWGFKSHQPGFASRLCQPQVCVMSYCLCLSEPPFCVLWPSSLSAPGIVVISLFLLPMTEKSALLPRIYTYNASFWIFLLLLSLERNDWFAWTEHKFPWALASGGERHCNPALLCFLLPPGAGPGSSGGPTLLPAISLSASNWEAEGDPNPLSDSWANRPDTLGLKA